MMAESTINSPSRDTQRPPKVNTFLNLFNNWLLDSKCNFTLSLEYLFFLYYQNKTTNVLINYCEVFLDFCCCFVKVQSLFLGWIGLSLHRKPSGIITRAHRWVSAWLPDIAFENISFFPQYFGNSTGEPTITEWLSCPQGCSTADKKEVKVMFT